ncbi:hypothetical protein KTF56_28960 [Burkholderia gladioli]|uniref:hypothetical protein n=1 Tax=Burkholderia gladioli TaxID=28095 RepID=UPI001C21483C|nr:hypothetical protein [Burkholderia gladioli]MBU9686927.1 hypothetical protein [Burkholderia gladioli]
MNTSITNTRQKIEILREMRENYAAELIDPYRAALLRETNHRLKQQEMNLRSLEEFASFTAYLDQEVPTDAPH